MMTVEWRPLVYKFADGRVLDLSDTHQVSNTGLIYNNMRKHVSKDEPKPIMPGGKDNRYRCFGINMQRFTGKNSVKRNAALHRVLTSKALHINTEAAISVILTARHDGFRFVFRDMLTDCLLYTSPSPRDS